MPITSSLQVSYRPIGSFSPYPKNARTHSPAQVAQIVYSIQEFGFVNPVLVDENNTLIAGHGRLEAASLLGMEEIPAIELAGLTAAQKRGLRIADNKLTINSGWDPDLLRMELSDLKMEGWDLGLTGFSGMEIEQFFAPETSPETEWQSMPEFNQNDLGAHQSIVVHFPNQAAVEAFATLVGQTLTNKTRFIWFPQAQEDAYIDKRYTAADVPDIHTLKGAF